MASTPPQRVRSPGLRLSGLVRAVLTVEKKDTEVAEAFFASSAHARHDETLSAGEADSAYQQVFHADASTSNTAATLAVPMAVTTVATTELCTVLKTDSGEARRTSLSATDHGNDVHSGGCTAGTVLSKVVLTNVPGFDGGRPSATSVTGALRLLHFETEAPGVVSDGDTIGSLVCLYAVSDSVSGAGSLLPSILEPFAPDVRRAVVCAEPTRGQALVFVWFESGLAGRRFEAYMNGQPFDREHGSEQCHVMLLSSLVISDTESDAAAGLKQCFEIPRCPVCLERLDHTLEPTLPAPMASRGAALPPCWRGIWEKCPVCTLLRVVERESDGSDGCSAGVVVTTKGNSSRAEDDGCNAAQATTKAVAKTALLAPVPSSVDSPRCSVCGEADRLWACMACGFVGCSRPQYGAEDAPSGPVRRKGHMLEHWLGTRRTHKLAIGLTSQWIWDYQLDGFVHHSESDAPDDSPSKAAPSGATENSGTAITRNGQPRFTPVEPADASAAADASAIVVEVTKSTPAGSSDTVADASASRMPSGAVSSAQEQDCPVDFKSEQIMTEYVGLLSSQLESQRRYFADTTAEVVAAARSRAEALRADTMAAQNECAKLEATLAVSTAALDSAVGAQRASAEKLSAAFNALRDERSRCQSLMAEQSSWQAKVSAAKEAAQTELNVRRERLELVREENADLAAAVAVQRRIRSAPAAVQLELLNGSIEVGDASSSWGDSAPAARGKRRSRGRGRR